MRCQTIDLPVVTVKIQRFLDGLKYGTRLSHRPRKVVVVGPVIVGFIDATNRDAQLSAPAQKVLDGGSVDEVANLNGLLAIVYGTDWFILLVNDDP